jgi:hypothetical protein
MTDGSITAAEPTLWISQKTIGQLADCKVAVGVKTVAFRIPRENCAPLYSADALAALRRERDDLRAGFYGRMAAHLSTQIAQKDAALRDAREFVVRLVGHLKSAQQTVEAIDAALTASQEKTND